MPRAPSPSETYLRVASLSPLRLRVIIRLSPSKQRRSLLCVVYIGGGHSFILERRGSRESEHLILGYFDPAPKFFLSMKGFEPHMVVLELFLTLCSEVNPGVLKA